MEKRAHDIYLFVANNPNCTELEIARGVGLKKTPYTRWILFSLIEHKYIARIWDESRDRKAYVYYCQETVPMDLQ